MTTGNFGERILLFCESTIVERVRYNARTAHTCCHRGVKAGFSYHARPKSIGRSTGGDLLYAAEGVRLWQDEGECVGLVSRVGEDYPRAWIDDLAKQGYLTAGIKVLPEDVDLRFFRAYTDLRTKTP